MTTRIDQRFAALKREGRAALVTFTMAGESEAGDQKISVGKGGRMRGSCACYNTMKSRLGIFTRSRGRRAPILRQES
jgi:hypothetical protein